MSDTLLDRIAAVQAKHLLVRYDRRAWWCQCGDDCLSVEGSHSFHVADAVIDALGLRPERGQRSKPDGPLWGSDNRYTVHRWVTEWRADDE